MLNWSRLYEQGRCKAIGVPWTDAEAYAAHNLRIPAKYVRMGILTKEELDEELTKNEPVEEKSKAELLKEAKELGSNATTAATSDVLEKEIEQLRKEAKAKGVKGVHLYKTKEALEKALSK